jgi:hypothetical protein
VNAHTPDFKPENEGLDPKKILDYIHAKDGNRRVVCGIETFVWIREACGYKFAPIFAQFPIVKSNCPRFLQVVRTLPL